VDHTAFLTAVVE